MMTGIKSVKEMMRCSRLKGFGDLEQKNVRQINAATLKWQEPRAGKDQENRSKRVLVVKVTGLRYDITMNLPDCANYILSKKS